MDTFIKNRRFDLRKVWEILLPIVLLLSNIFLFGPFTIYQTNVDEFIVPLFVLLRIFLLPALLVGTILLMIGLLLPQKLHQRYVALIFIIGILLWLQGNIFAWDYGFADGREINWEQTMWRGWIDGTVWIIFLIIASIFYKHLYKIAILTSLILIVLQVVYSGITSLQKPDVWKKKEAYATSVASPEKIFEFSSKQNVIHIILDELQSTIFQEIIAQYPEYYQTALEGFTFFRETTGSFPTTVMSIPAILSGKVYNNDIPIWDFLDTVYTGKTVPNILYAEGYDIDLAVPFDNIYNRGQYTNYYVIPVPYGVTKYQYDLHNSAIILDLVLFRYNPHFLKKFHFQTRLWLAWLNFSTPTKIADHLQNQEQEQYQAARHLAHKTFLSDFVKRISVKRETPIYKFIHITTTHWPIVLNKDCQYTGEILSWTWDNIKTQAKCSLDDAIKLLEKLKQLDIYDSSFIILQADHGYWKISDSAHEILINNSGASLENYFLDTDEYVAQILSAASPLLAIKLPDSSSAFTVSDAHAMLTDIPATISNVLNLHENFQGRSVFEIKPDEIRAREFRYYDRLNQATDQYFDRMDKFIIRGNKFDKTSWQFLSHLTQVSLYGDVSQINLGDWKQERFLRSGWSGTGESQDGFTYRWALGESASIWLALPKDKTIRLIAQMKNFHGSQVITIKVDGELIGHWNISHRGVWEKYSISIPSQANRPDVSVVEFNFSQHSMPNEKESRPLAALFESITLNKE